MSRSTVWSLVFLTFPGVVLGATLKPAGVVSFFVTPGEPAQLQWKVEGGTLAEPLEYSLMDYSGKAVASGRAKLIDSGGVEVTLKMQQGFFEIEFLATKQRFGVVALPDAARPCGPVLLHRRGPLVAGARRRDPRGARPGGPPQRHPHDPRAAHLGSGPSGPGPLELGDRCPLRHAPPHLFWARRRSAGDGPRRAPLDGPRRASAIPRTLSPRPTRGGKSPRSGSPPGAGWRSGTSPTSSSAATCRPINMSPWSRQFPTPLGRDR